MLLVLLIVAISCINATAFACANAQRLPVALTIDEQETITTIRRSFNGFEETELAFRAPAKGVPKHVIDMFCANVKLRLYWGVYRETIKGTSRTGQDVRRMARLTRHYYPEIRAVDKPFDAPKLSKVDEWLGVKEDATGDKSSLEDFYSSDSEIESDKINSRSRFKKIKMKVKIKLKQPDDQDDEDEADRQIKQKMDASLADNGGESTNAATGDSTSENPKRTRLQKMKDYVKKYAPKVGMGIYTRWATMWWLMMSCLFTKYYLWDPALDEFIKLKKTLIMYPDFLMLKLQDIDCLSTKFFQRIISACKILNPLLNFSFGQLSLDNLMRFKGKAS